MYFTLETAAGRRDCWAEDGSTLTEVLAELAPRAGCDRGSGFGFDVGSGLDVHLEVAGGTGSGTAAPGRPLCHGALVQVGTDTGMDGAAGQSADVRPGGWRLIRLGSALAGESVPLRSPAAPVRAGTTRRGKVLLSRQRRPRSAGPRTGLQPLWLGRVRQSRRGRLTVHWRRLRWRRRCGAGTVLRTASGEVWALVQEPVGTATQAATDKRNWAAAASAAATGLIMAVVMFFVTRNPIWAAMPLAGVVATILPVILHRRRPPWPDSVAGLTPASTYPVPLDGPAELIGSPGPVAALARRAISQGLEACARLPVLDVPLEPPWAWARFAGPDHSGGLLHGAGAPDSGAFAAPSEAALRVELIPGGLRLTPGPSWPRPPDLTAPEARSRGPATGYGPLGGLGGPVHHDAVTRWIVKDAGLGLLAARAPGRQPFRAAGLGAAALEGQIRQLATRNPIPGVEEPFPLTAQQVAANWRGPATRPAIGPGPDGLGLRLDLTRDGPHALVAGTSGSGKSEFLRALMLSECVATPPDRLTIVGVDHKGGATFRDLEHLPHVVGVATDLDAAGTSRVLTSLEAELAGRERLLERHAVTAWRELPAAARPPRLLVVVDEFRTLLDALPEAAGRLERLAAQGRSLGMGLILATQRPAGAVSAQLRANLALRICFRVATEADSLDVLGSADAAGIDPAKPGSCVIASAGRPPIALRVRMVPPPPRRPATEVSWPAQWAPPPAAPADPASLVNAIQRAAAAAGAKAPAAPWRPPLPTELPVASLIWPGKAGGRTGSHGAKVAGGDGEGRENTGSLFNGVLLGLVDRPALQIQESLVWDPATGHLAILGPPRSGRTTAAVTAAAGLAAAGWDTHVITHRPDAFRGLLGMARLGSVVDGRASDLIAELLGRLGREPVAVVLDAPAELEACVIGALARPLIEAIVQGALAPGAAVVVTAAAKPARWLSLCPHRLILPVSDLTDALTLGIPRELAGGARIPGRACYLGGDSAAMAQIALTTAAAGAARPAGTRTRSEGQRGYSGPVYPQDPGRSNLQTPKRVLELPDQVCSAELPPDAPGIIWVGLGGHYGTALGLPLRQAQPIAVIGPPGSGRSTILATWRQRLEAAGHPVTMPGCGGQRRWPEIIDALAAGQVVLADDLESVSGPPPSALPPKGTLIASYTTTTAAALRPPTQLFHANPLGLLLGPGGRGPAAAFGPGANTGSPLGLSGGSVPAQPPGRGRLIVGSKSYAIQAAA